MTSHLCFSEGGHYREFSAQLVGKPVDTDDGLRQHDPFGNATLCNDKWVLRKYGKPMLMTAGGYMVDPREYVGPGSSSGLSTDPGPGPGTSARELRPRLWL